MNHSVLLSCSAALLLAAPAWAQAPAATCEATLATRGNVLTGRTVTGNRAMPATADEAFTRVVQELRRRDDVELIEADQQRGVVRGRWALIDGRVLDIRFSVRTSDGRQSMGAGEILVNGIPVAGPNPGRWLCEVLDRAAGAGASAAAPAPSAQPTAPGRDEAAAKQEGFRIGEWVRGTIAAADEQDTYPLTLTTSDTLIVQLRNPYYRVPRPSRAPSLRFRIRDLATRTAQWSERLDYVSDTEPLFATQNLVVLPPGSYQLQVDATEPPQQALTYGFQLLRHTSTPEAGEGPLRPGTAVEGRVDYGGDRDRFRFEAEAGQEVKVVVEPIDGSGAGRTLDARVLDPHGDRYAEVIALQPGEAAESDWHRLPGTGTYHLEIEGFVNVAGPAHTGRYRVTVRIRN